MEVINELLTKKDKVIQMIKQDINKEKDKNQKEKLILKMIKLMKSLSYQIYYLIINNYQKKIPIKKKQ